MRFLIDQNLDPIVAQELRNAGHDCVHTSEIGLSRAIDPIILKRAFDEDRVLVSADHDFSLIHAVNKSTKPSVILIRGTSNRRALRQVEVILNNLPTIESALLAGSIVVLKNEQARVRSLPID